MITSINNPAVKNIIALQKKPRLRREQEVFLVEGPKLVSEIPEGYLKELYVSEEFAAEGQWEGLLEGKPCERVSARVLREMSDTQTPQGILAVVRQRHSELSDMLRQERPHLLLLEDIQDPGNLGTMLRAGEGAGVTGIVMSRGCVDIYNPKVIRSTMGSVYRVPFVYADDFHETLCEIKKSCRVYAAHLKGEAYYDEADYTEATAMIIGNEAKGIREETAALADTLIRIPMEGQVESLNAAIAASILMYEVYRQRRR